MAEFQVCVVCSTPVETSAGSCPRCAEPRVRICVCAALVTIDQRACPSCSRVLPRVIPMEERERRQRRVHLVLGAVGVVALAGAAAAIWPFVRDNRQASALRVEAFATAASGDTEASVKQLTAYLALRPGDAEAHALLAAAHFALDETDAGLAEARRARAINPASPGTQLIVAKHLLAKGETLAALSEARAAPEPGAAAIVARALARLGHSVEAAAAFDLALTGTPDDPELRADAAVVHALLADADWPGAAEHRRRAEELCDAVVRSIGPLLNTSGPAAIRAARATARALQADPSPDASAIEEAAATALRAAPDDQQVRVDVARALLAAGRTAAAIAALGDAPSGAISVSVRVARARTFRDCGRDADGAAELKSALQRDSADVGAAVAAARLRIDARRPLDAMGVLSAARAAGAPEAPDLLEAAADAAMASIALRDAQRDRQLDPGGRADSDALRSLVAWQSAAPRDPRPLRHMLDILMPAALRRRRSGLGTDVGTRAALTHLDELAALDADDRTLLYWRVQWDTLAARDSEAATRFARLMKAYPDVAQVRELRIERAFDGLGDERPETLAAAWAMTRDPPLVDVHAFTREALRHGKCALAIDVAAAALDRHPDDARIVGDLARALLGSGRATAAGAAIDAAPQSVRALRELADLQLVTAAISGAALPLEQVAPPDANLDQLLAAARALSIAGRTTDADAVFQRARVAAGSLAAALARVAEALECADRNEEAAATWDAAESSAPGDIELQARSGSAWLAHGAKSTRDARSAAAARLVAAQAHPDGAAAAIALRGAFAVAGGDAAAGIEDIRQALAAAPERLDLRVLLAIALLDADSPEESVAEARLVRVLLPTSIPGRRVLALGLTRVAASKAAAGELLAAIATLEEASTLVVGAADPAASLALGLRRAALTPAAMAFCIADAERPTGAGSRLVLALCASARGDHAEAETLATRVVEDRSDLPGGPVVRAFVRALAGRAEDAASDVATANEMNAPAADAAFAHATALARSGDSQRAESTLEPWTGLGGSPRVRAAAAEMALGDEETRERALAAFADLLVRAPTEADAMGLHAWGAALAVRAATDPPGSVRATAARGALRRALVVYPQAPESPATREALSRLR